ncbi:helix-turn-helix domain-containing protein [Trueperella pecoris]|uniref:Helix-turn-helix domain-containing protein n=1 Tax=Trueperella pecoris TaxID=2733571 RepID=A0A7M1QUE3_9ACTO|nr:helix-turn-helix domain-containing protein [Trueperella pecoris]QOR45476.1 helix-turn-helix domain-containing protein [Trueperella pecoris]
MGAKLAAWMLGQADKAGSARGLLVLSVLALHADEAGESIMSWAELCERTHISRSQLARELKELEDSGLVTRSVWKWGQANGATRYALALPDGVDLEEEVSPSGRVPSGDSPVMVQEEADIVPVQAGSLRIQDPLSPDGLRAMLVFAQAYGWDGISTTLGEALAVTVDTRLGWLIARRAGMERSQARADVLSRMWEAVRSHTQTILDARTNPWGVLVRIVARDVARADSQTVPEVLTGEVIEGDHLDHERGVGRVLLADIFDSWGGAHQQFLHVLVVAGVSQGLAFNATRRMLEIAVQASPALRITRARCDVDLRAMGLSEDAIGAWMGLVVGTRRGGDASSLVLHFASGGELTDEFRARVERLARLV